eukprot:3656470-Amphidinium_carterae.2
MMVARRDAYVKLSIFRRTKDARSVDLSSIVPINVRMGSLWRRRCPRRLRKKVSRSQESPSKKDKKKDGKEGKKPKNKDKDGKKKTPRRPKAREAAVPEDEEDAEDSNSQDEQASEEESQSEAVLEEETSSDSDGSSSEESSVEGAMAVITEVTSEEDQPQPQAYATATKTPMFLDPAGKAYALADLGATDVTLNLKHLGKKKADATPVEMTIASGNICIGMKFSQKM